VCCTSPADCNSIGATGDTERPCTDGFVCISHECTTAPDAPPIPACTDNTQCTNPLTPICDEQSCTACTDDAQCASTVCDAPTGACIAEANVLYVAAAGAGASDCTRLQPCTLSHAVDIATATRSSVKMSPGNYDASIAITGKDLVVHGDGATLTALGGNAALDVQAGAHVRIEGLSIVNQGDDAAIYCNGQGPPSIDLSRMVITSDGTTANLQSCTSSIRATRFVSTGTGSPNVLVAEANVTIDRSLIDGGNGVLAEGGGSLVHITNSLFVNQLGSYGPFTGSALFANNGPGSMFVSFSTVIGSVVKCEAKTPTCAGGSGVGSCIDNTIIYAPSATDAVQGNCSVSYSLASPQTTALIGGNNILGVDPLFNGATDYHLQMTSPAVDAADPAVSNSVDYDGVTRPQGTRRDMGAFEYH
jgi:hypothetical protein